jgi:hypothetical protein
MRVLPAGSRTDLPAQVKLNEIHRKVILCKLANIHWELNRKFQCVFSWGIKIYPEDGSSRFLQNVGMYAQDYVASHPVILVYLFICGLCKNAVSILVTTGRVNNEFHMMWKEAAMC